MNLPEWRRALERANLLPEYQDVLDGFASGFGQGIPDHTIDGQKWFTPPNHTSANLAREKIEQSFKNELATGQMYGPFTHEEVAERFPFFRSSPLGAVVNGDGSTRPINDLSFPRNDPNIPLLLLDTRISFGGVAGCGSFGRPANAWKHIMLHEFDLATVFRWVDDNLFVKEVESTVNMDEVAERSRQLGVLTNVDKYSPFQDEQKFIGFVWNGVERTVRLPEGKLDTRILQIKRFLQTGHKYSYEEVEVLTGQLAHTDCQPRPDYGIGVIVAGRWARFKLVPNWKSGPVGTRNIAWLETVAIRLGLLMLLLLGARLGKVFSVETDNTTTQSAINKRRSKDVAINKEWRIIQDTLIKNQINIAARRVASANNRADALSRGVVGSLNQADQLMVKLPEDLVSALRQDWT
ncbi:hypothetical protein PSTG_04702 [Puccinia striiformis f. sp. tritici PST-78]|uniref:Uncharacterized protein n=1 Tax=Puccinia striiformis f. sp. tritici PST-78 TaxID=1165861 RepID=A0A0L0VT60_9BASI|nr:hypothetical protein PSTG_04702 [Puccinia striiformis f. sp. tritici PST-78]